MTPMTPQNSPKYVSPAEAVRYVKSGDTIVVQGSTSIPTVLLNALTERAAELSHHRQLLAYMVVI